LISLLARHPLARALRIDKLTVAALEATLTGPTVPVLQALSVHHRDFADRAKRIAKVLVTAGIEARAVDSQAAVGGGGAPGVSLASAAVSLPASLTEPLRRGQPVRTGQHPAVVGRVFEGRLLLDLYAIDPDDDDRLAAAVLDAVLVREDTPPAGGHPRTPDGPEPPAGRLG
jgi:L-seryl-tRNA(Ser) seleniumtransferase